MSDTKKGLEKDPKHRDATDAMLIAKTVTDLGIGEEEVQDIYSKWAEGYDSDIKKGMYVGPQKVAEAMAGYVEKSRRGDVKILDFGAGTGLVGESLQKKGFLNIDALEPNEIMLQEGMKKKVYQRGIQAYLLGSQKLDIPENEYDYAVSVGCFNEGHIKSDCFAELVRITKPGGYILFTISQKALTTIPEYRDRLIPSLKKFSEQELIIEEIRELPDYFDNAKGSLFCLKVI